MLTEICPYSASELSVHHTGKFLYKSFFFAQGSMEFHADLLSYFKILHPKWRLNNHTQKDLSSMLQPVFEEFILKRRAANTHKNFDINNANAQITDAQSIASVTVNKWLDNLNNTLVIPQQSDRPTLISKITESIIDRDHYFLYLNGGRPRPADSPERWESHFKKYVLDKTPTGLVDFNILMQEAFHHWQQSRQHPAWDTTGEYDIANNNNSTPGNKLSIVAGIWETHQEEDQEKTKKPPRYFPEELAA